MRYNEPNAQPTMKKTPLALEIIGPSSLLSVGILYGLLGSATKYLGRSINAYQVIEYRFGIACLAAIVIMLVTGRKIKFKHVDISVLIIFLITFPAATIIYTVALFHTSVAVASFSFFASLVIAQFVIGRIFFHEKLDTYKAFAFAAAVISILAFTDPFHGFELSTGLLLGLLSGLIEAVASGYQKHVSGATDKLSLLMLQSLAGTVIVLFILGHSHATVLPILHGYELLAGILVGLATLAIMALFLVGYKYTNLHLGSIIVSSELIFSPLFAYLLLGENIPRNVFVGGMFTLASAVLVSLPAKKSFNEAVQLS